jgi:DNA-binding PucR family transcriptional regulator
VNSVYYHLERIRSLLGADFDEPPRAFELHFALRARRLLSSEDRGA